MAERLAYLEAVVGADITQFRKGMRDIRNEAGVFSETMRGLAGIGRTLTFAFTVPMVALGATAAKAASEFDASMRNINSIAQLTEGGLQDLTVATLNFGKATRGGAIAASESLYTVFSAGITDTTEAFNIMEIATKTAEAGLAGMTTTTEALIGVLLAYDDTSQAAAMHTSDAITQMVQIGVGSMENFANALGNVVPTASMIGMSINDLMGNMAFLTQRGQSAAKASTNLNSALTSMLKPSEAMSKAFQRLGATDSTMLIEMFGGVNGAIEALIGAADGSAPVLAKMFNNIRGLRAVGQMASNMDMWKKSLNSFADSVEGATDRAHEQQMLSFAATWDLMTSALQAASIAIGNALLPLLKPVVQAFTDFGLAISNVNPELMKLVVIGGTIAAILPPLIWGFASLATPIGALVVGIGFLVTTIGTDLIGSFADFLGSSAGFKTELQELSEIIESITGFDFMADDVDTPSVPVMENLVLPDIMASAMVEGKSTSMGQIYADHYFNDMSWQVFIDMMAERGWAGGAVLPDAKFTFPNNAPEIINVVDTMITFQQALDIINIEIAHAELDTFSVARAIEDEADMAAHMDRLWVDFKAQFNIVWNKIVGWIDGKAVEIADSFSSWFDDASMQPLYDALSLALDGNFEAALDKIFPGTSENIGNLFDGLFGLDAELQIGHAIVSLGTSAANFILNKFVPAISQMTGLIAGKIGAAFYNFIIAGIAFFTSGQAGDLGGSILTSISTFITDNVITPLTTGFNDGIAGSDFETGLNVFKTAIEGIFSELNIGSAWAGLTIMFEGLVSGMEQIAAADWSGVAKLGIIVGIVAGSIFKSAMTFISGAAAGIGAGFDTLGGAIGSFIDILAAAANGSIDVRDLLGFVFEIGVAIIQFPLGILEGLVGAILSFLGIDFTLPNVAGALGDWSDDILLELEVGKMKIVEWDATTAQDAINEIFNEFLDDSWGFSSVVSDWELNVQNVVVDFSKIDISDMAISNLQDMVDDIYYEDIANDAKGGLYNQFYEAWSNIEGLEMPEPIGIVAEFELVGYDPSTMVGGDMGSLLGDSFVTSMTKAVKTRAAFAVKQGLEEASPESQAAMSSFMSNIAIGGGATDEEGNISASPIIDNFLIPLESEWLRLFGESGTMSIAYGEYAGAIANDTTAIQTAMTALLTYVGGEFQTLPASILTSTRTARDYLLEVGDAAKAARQEIAKVIALGEETIWVEINVNSTGVGDFETGLWEVPQDNFPANLHKGEMVVPADMAGQLRDNGIPTGLLVSSGGTSNSSTVNQITISGVQDVDGLLRELNRRGINLDG